MDRGDVIARVTPGSAAARLGLAKGDRLLTVGGRPVASYGDVQYADPVNKKYPIDTPEHVRAAWSYIHHEDNKHKYNSEDARKIEGRIKRAAIP